MSKYLKMADVFVGKVKEGLTINGPSIHGDNHKLYANTKDRRIAEYAAHAINSHDELVAMNQELLDALEFVISDKAPGYHDCIDDGEAECTWCIARKVIAKTKGQ